MSKKLKHLNELVDILSEDVNSLQESPRSISEVLDLFKKGKLSKESTIAFISAKFSTEFYLMSKSIIDKK